MTGPSRWLRPRIGLAVLAAGAVALVLAACGGSSTHATAATAKRCSNIGTSTPGVIRVAIEPFMPIIGEVNGHLSGLDGDNMKLLAKDLGCRISIFQADFAGDLAAVQSHRVDLAIGSIGWTKLREQAGLFTDPLYYQVVNLAERKSTDITTVSQMEGRVLCTVTGFVFIPAMQEVPHATVRTYSTIQAMLLDVADGRCDVGFGNPLVIAYAVTHNPSLKDVTYRVLKQPTPAELEVAPAFGPVAAGYEDAIYLPPGDTKLERALNPLIDRMVRDGTEARLLKKWGVNDPQYWLTPRDSLVTERIGVDRPVGWKAPQCAGAGCE